MSMLKKMVSYLQDNREVVGLIRSGQASLVGVSPAQQRALVEVIGTQGQEKPEVSKLFWI